MPKQRPFQAGDVVVTLRAAYTGGMGRGRVPAGTLAVIETVKPFGSTASGKSAVFATVPATGETRACFWLEEIRLVEDRTDG